MMDTLDARVSDTLHIPRLLLMDHAGLAVAREAQARCPDVTRPIVVCCGTGFNGGDGLAAARHLAGWGRVVRIVVAGPLDRLREEPATYARIVQALGVELTACTRLEELDSVTRWLSACGLIIDALLGIGARGPVREPMASLIDAMNRAGTPIVSADIPSGLDGDTGRVQGIAVRATVTVTFGLPKQGCFLEAGPAHAGTVVTDPITMPQRLLEGARPR